MKYAYSINYPYEPGDIKVGEFENDLDFAKEAFLEAWDQENLDEAMADAALLDVAGSDLVDYLLEYLSERIEADVRFLEIK